VDLKATRFAVNDVGVATIWLHRPHRHNAWTGRMHAEYRHIMATLEADLKVRAVVVTGTPPAFCVGGDSDALAGHAERGAYDAGVPADVAKPGYGVRPEWDHDFAWQYGLRLPIIAAVNGACAGVALALVCFCDLRVVAATAKITTAAPKLGLPAEYGLSYTLPRLIGLSRATDLLLTGRVVTGAQSADWGLWNEVAPDGESALVAAQALARHLATAVAPTSITATKRQIYADLNRDVGSALTEAAALLGSMTATADYREGVAALREKRPPTFPG
jgi:enoyl-CoA hydratase/carnithine racemase